VRVSALASSGVTLAWADKATNEAGYVVERKSGSGSYAPVGGLLAANVHAYADTGLAAGTGYTYRVKAVNAGGSSAFSGAVSATTLAGGATRIEDADPRVAYAGTWTTSTATQLSGGSARVAAPTAASAT